MFSANRRSTFKLLETGSISGHRAIFVASARTGKLYLEDYNSEDSKPLYFGVWLSTSRGRIPDNVNSLHRALPHQLERGRPPRGAV